MDEAYIGRRIRKFKGYGKGEYLKNKTTLFEMVERGEVLRSEVVNGDKYPRCLHLIPIVNNARGENLHFAIIAKQIHH